MATVSNTTEVVCFECGFPVYVDETKPGEIVARGTYSADCEGCGEQYNYLHRNAEGIWTEKDGRQLLTAVQLEQESGVS